MMEGFQNSKYTAQSSPWMTFFTPTYNRRDTLHRCYDSLKAMRRPMDDKGQTVDFEWIVVDDGSSDDTYSLVKSWADEEIIPIRYVYQENRGKHVACNVGARLAKGEMMAHLDSDDALLDNALEVLYNGWMEIPAGHRSGFKGVTARCIDPETGKIIGTPLPRRPYYASTQDMRYRDRVEGEMFGFNRVDVLLEYPFPESHERMSFYPESVVWCEMGKKYMEYVVDVPVRKYYRDAANAITRKNTSRCRANYYLWRYMVNNLVGKYIVYSPKEMVKAVVGMSMDGFSSGRRLKTILGDVDRFAEKLGVLLLMPAGYILSKLR